MKYKLKIKNSNSRGFTLVEMLLTIAVVTIIAAVVIFNHQGFRREVALSNDAYGLALSLREAQVFGLSTRQVGDLNPSKQFSAGYGIHLDITENGYTVFIDDPDDSDKGDGKYNEEEDIFVEKVLFSDDIELYLICDISRIACRSETDILDVVFYRAEPGASIIRPSAGGGDITPSAARVYLRAPSGIQRCVDIVNTGQISVLGSAECR